MHDKKSLIYTEKQNTNTEPCRTPISIPNILDRYSLSLFPSDLHSN